MNEIELKKAIADVLESTERHVQAVRDGFLLMAWMTGANILTLLASSAVLLLVAWRLWHE